ncbi:hypothetical protein [Nocardioides taihuensis]|uniref:Uncharacterized protein n=1 Tax=Nocardioides taihuensis TaxID=1835606 RepID=A0ABW0BIU1_9ACTN
MNRPLPDSARLAWWGTAWLRGAVDADRLLDAVRGEDAVHTVGGDPFLVGLGPLRTAGATALGLALPAEGDPVGLGGPPAFNHAALEAGEAVVAVGAGRGLVPARVGGSVDWTVHAAERRQLPDVGEADRGLRRALLETANALADLDVARWRPEVADELADLRQPSAVTAPPGVPSLCLSLAGRALHALTVVDLALVDDGGALTVLEAEQRRTALRPLAHAGRRALVAACSPEMWPD